MQTNVTEQSKNQNDARFSSSGFGKSLEGRQEIKIWSISDNKTQPTAPPTESHDKPTEDATV